VIPYILTPLAEQDLIDIWDHITKDNLNAANRVLQRLELAMRKLARTPGIVHSREDLADRRQRFFLVYSYLIVYSGETRLESRSKVSET
jgi:plasmid stabilization system protein ParE